MSTRGNGKEKYNRRKFLRGIGASASLLPILEAERSEAGCLGTGPKRLVLVTWANGVRGNYWPSGANVTLSGYLSPFEPYKKDLIFLDGFYYRFLDETPNPDMASKTGHSSSQGLFTGTPYLKLLGDPPGLGLVVPTGPSIDQHLATQLKVPSLYLGARVYDGMYSVWRDAGGGKVAPLVPDSDPYHVFDTLFAGRPVAGEDPAKLRADAERLRRARQSVLDFLIKTDLPRFKRLLGAADQQRIEQHLQGIRDIEKQLQVPVPVSPATAIPGADDCAAPVIASDCNVSKDGKCDIMASANFPWVVKSQIDLLVGALAADAARVVVFQIDGHGGGNGDLLQLPWLTTTYDHAKDDGVTHIAPHPMGSHHQMAHSVDREGQAKVWTWFNEQFAYLIKQLTESTEGGQRMLDNTVVLFMNNMEEGEHHYYKVPCYLAGSCGGFFKTGRNLTVDNGTTHNGLLVALANAMDAPTPQFGAYTGDLTSLLRG